ncbi:unnamed protein product [Owenia fusiformis]|uniref:Uncharacterized protein n=1 Tax=Owenia fusiformis TaxID=6347 RepID=A0A8J1U9L0_OWEFU|nr:unnamed protein product [Owenia fusiformis]
MKVTSIAVFLLYVCSMVAILSCLQGVHGDLCTDYDEKELTAALHMKVTPKGGMYAGKYSKVPDAHDLTQCVKSCCGSRTCNTVFLHDETCFLIACNTTNPEACSPMERTEDRFSGSFMVELRTIDETNPVVHTPNYAVKEDCDPDADVIGCDINEVCKLQLTTSVIGYVCVCKEGYAVDQMTGACSRELPQKRPSDMTCEIGIIEDCLQYEECMPTSLRKRTGFCECIEDYHRDKDTGFCGKESETREQMEGSIQEASMDLPTKKKTDIQDRTLTTPTTTRTTADKEKTTTTKKPSVTDQVTEVLTEKIALENMTASTEGSLTNESSTSTTVHSASMIVTSTSTSLPSSSSVIITTSPTAVPKHSTTSTSTTDPKQPTSATATPEVEALVVSAGEDKEIQLPTNDITLSAYVISKSDTEADTEKYKYEWSIISHPDSSEIGNMVGQNSATLQLKNLIAGLYQLKVSVSAQDKFGDATVNVTVKPPARINKPPAAVAKPAFQEVKLPNDAVIDGSESTDDDGVTTYLWEEVEGPIREDKISSNKPMLVMKDLKPGNYKFKLTVTDTDGASNSTVAELTVIKETDYPPKANAGSNVIISLPHNKVTLYGNASTDDKGIATYEWITKSDDDLTADITGVRTPFLHLSNLQVGDYTFTLKVTDTAGQTSTADVTVFVKPEHNKAPIADAGKNYVVKFPLHVATLDGSNSHDDQKITKYLWKIKSGPKGATLENADRETASVSDLVEGIYEFTLTVFDEEDLQDTDTVKITVKPDINKPPVAVAGSDQRVSMSQKLVAIDGRASNDDKGIVSYKWTRDDNSLAAGDVLNNSDSQAVLQLANLVEGRYIFTLTVADIEGQEDSDSASVIVNHDDNSDNLIEIQLESNIKVFSEANKKTLADQLALLIHSAKPEGDVQVRIQHLGQDEHTGRLTVKFYVVTHLKNVDIYHNGVEAVKVLKRKLKSNGNVLDFNVQSVDTVVCQNNCSGHGHCDQFTKSCVCEAFWMENFIKAQLEESNCDWSILYVIIVSFISVITFAGVVWGAICLFKRCKLKPSRRKHRYKLLDEYSDRENIQMVPKNNNYRKRRKSRKANSSGDNSETTRLTTSSTCMMNGSVEGRVAHDRLNPSILDESEHDLLSDIDGQKSATEESWFINVKPPPRW